jgi:hypothetical protein
MKCSVLRALGDTLLGIRLTLDSKVAHGSRCQHEASHAGEDSAAAFHSDS